MGSSPSEPTGSLGDEFLKRGDEVKMLNPYEAMGELKAKCNPVRAAEAASLQRLANLARS